MKRLLVLTLIAVGLLAAQTASSAGDAKGPPCSNITNGDGGYGVLSTNLVDFTVFLDAPACSFVTYTFYVTDANGTPITSTSSYDTTACIPENSGEGCVHFSLDLGSDSPDLICVYATTDIYGHLTDQAPDASCLLIRKGSAAASGTFG
jgi:hypothetical protein